MSDLPFPEKEVPGTKFRALTFNVMKPSRGKGCHAWEKRKESVVSFLHRVRENDRELSTASILCLQNTSEPQRVFLKAELNFQYKTDGSNMVAWNPELWELKDEKGVGFGPEYGLTNKKILLPSSGNKRMITVFLRNKETKEVIVVSSVELKQSKLSMVSRSKQAKAICRELRTLGENQIVGISSFSKRNIFSSPVSVFKKNGWIDVTTLDDVPVANDNKISWHKYNKLRKGRRVDYLYVRTGLAPRYVYNINTSRECESPSEHTFLTVGLSVLPKESTKE